MPFPDIINRRPLFSLQVTLDCRKSARLVSAYCNGIIEPGFVGIECSCSRKASVFAARISASSVVPHEIRMTCKNNAKGSVLLIESKHCYALVTRIITFRVNCRSDDGGGQIKAVIGQYHTKSIFGVEVEWQSHLSCLR